MESKIKIYGPPIDKAITELLKLSKDLPTISKGNISRSIIPSGETLMGDFDFVFHWAKVPDVDEALKDIGCRYTINTTIDSINPYRL